MNLGPISQLALSQYTASLSMVKAQANASQQVVNMIAEIVEAGKVTASRGNAVNIAI